MDEKSAPDDRTGRHSASRCGTETGDSDSSGSSKHDPALPSTSAMQGSMKRPNLDNQKNVDASSTFGPNVHPKSSQKSAKISRGAAASRYAPQHLEDARLVASLTRTIPAKYGTLELVVERQPETHHRARYKEEGCRGCIRDRTGNSCPAVQLKGIEHDSILQIFVATEGGQVCPHPLYRLCKAGGSTSTPCRQRIIENTNVLEMEIDREKGGLVNIDCMGIIGLRSSDLEAFEADECSASSDHRKKRGGGLRLVFRAITECGKTQAPITLQVCSTPISCSPIPGVPEIHRISHANCPASGGLDLFVLGKNFVKSETKMFVQEVSDTNGEEVIWQREAQLERELFDSAHMVAAIPPYHKLLISQAVNVQIIIQNKAKISDPHPFAYVPDDAVKRLLQRKDFSRLSSIAEDGKTAQKSLSQVPSGAYLQGPPDSRAFTQPRSRSSTIASYSDYSLASAISRNLGIPQNSIAEASMARQLVGGSMEQVNYCLQTPTGSLPILVTMPHRAPQQTQTMNTLEKNDQMSWAMASSRDCQPSTSAAHYPQADQTNYDDFQQMRDFLWDYEPNELESAEAMQTMNGSALDTANPNLTSDELSADELIREITEWRSS